MAISWGSWSAGQSGSKSRLGVDRSVSSTASQTTVTVKIYIEFSGYYAYTTGTLTLSGGHSASRTVTLEFSGSGTKYLGSFSSTFTRPYGSNSSRSTSASLTGFAGGSPRLSTWYTIPRRKYSAPPEPSSITVSRVSDSSADVAWYVYSTTAAPVESVEVIRRVNNDGWVYAGATVNRASGTLRVGNQSRGNRYQWAVKGKNRDSEGPWGHSPWLYQRPRDVANVVAERATPNIELSWVDRNSITYGEFEIYDNGTLVATVPASTTSWTHVSPDPSRLHTYSVRATYNGLDADHVYSNTVQLLAAPLAPTDLDPDGGYVVAGETTRLEWSHNTVDGTVQTVYELRVRRDGMSSWTTYTGTTSEYRDISVADFAGDGDAVEWQVRTKGEHAEWSPWSAVASAGVATRPVVTIDAPAEGAVIESASVQVVFTVSRAPASYRVRLKNASGTVLQTVEDYILTTSASVVLKGLRNNRAYSIDVIATDKVDSLLVERSITVDYAQPDSPILDGAWDVLRGAVQVTASVPASSDPVPHSIRIMKRMGPRLPLDADATRLRKTLRVVEAQTEGRNLLQNSDFSLGADGGGWTKLPTIQRGDDGVLYIVQDYGWTTEIILDTAPGTYTISTYVQNPSADPSAQARISISVYEGETSLDTLSDITPIDPFSGWVRVSTTVEVPSNGDRIRVYLLNATADSTAGLRWTKAKIERGDTATTWTLAPEDVEADLSQVEDEIIDATTWETLATVPADAATTVIDEYARIHDSAQYVAYAIATVGGEEVESPPSWILDMGTIPEPADFLNWGDGNVARIRYRPELSRSSSASDLVLIDLDDGTADPVAIFGPKERHTTSLSGMLLDDPTLSARDQALTFADLAIHRGLVLLRPIDAAPVWGVVADVSVPREMWGGYQVSLTHTKAR